MRLQEEGGAVKAGAKGGRDGERIGVMNLLTQQHISPSATPVQTCDLRAANLLLRGIRIYRQNVASDGLDEGPGAT
jgi:hypothetical protein